MDVYITKSLSKRLPEAISEEKWELCKTRYLGGQEKPVESTSTLLTPQKDRHK